MGDPDPRRGVSGKKVVIVFVILGVAFIALWSLLAVFVFTKQSVIPTQQQTGPK